MTPAVDKLREGVACAHERRIYVSYKDAKECLQCGDLWWPTLAHRALPSAPPSPKDT